MMAKNTGTDGEIDSCQRGVQQSSAHRTGSPVVGGRKPLSVSNGILTSTTSTSGCFSASGAVLVYTLTDNPSPLATPVDFMSLPSTHLQCKKNNDHGCDRQERWNCKKQFVIRWLSVGAGHGHTAFPMEGERRERGYAA